MKKFSLYSLGLIIGGVVSFVLSNSVEDYAELTFLLGIVSCLVGVIFSFVAISKQEEGMMKLISLSSFFIIFFIISWFEPFQFVRVFTWLKNIAG